MIPVLYLQVGKNLCIIMGISIPDSLSGNSALFFNLLTQ